MLHTFTNYTIIYTQTDRHTDKPTLCTYTQTDRQKLHNNILVVQEVPTGRQDNIIASCDPVTYRWSSGSNRASITWFTRFTLLTLVNICHHGNMVVTYIWSWFTNWSFLTINSGMTDRSSGTLWQCHMIN